MPHACFRKDGDPMGWIEGLNASVDYIEEHLDGDVDIARAASFASCTEGQFPEDVSILRRWGWRSTCANVVCRAPRSICLGASACSMWRCGMATLRQRRSIEHSKRPLAYLPVRQGFPAPLFSFSRGARSPLPLRVRSLSWRVVSQPGMRLRGNSGILRWRSG